MGRCLIVANQTLGGAELDRKVADRIEHGEGRFYVVVPMVEPETEANWAPEDPAFGLPARVEAAAGAMEEARKRSQHRLRRMIDRIEALGGEAEGEVGPPDPYTATVEVLGREAFDEVIISTLPPGLSRWVKMDLPSRVDRQASCPVTTVEAQP